MIQNILLFLILPFIQTFDLISFEMTQRSGINGQTIKSSATIYFRDNGEMVTKYSPPSTIFVFNNLDGEVKIYNEKDNTVIQSVNYKTGTANTNFHAFLKGQLEDLGLRQSGFVLKSTKVEDGLVISEWIAPMDFRDNFATVELVHKGEKPIFLGHKKLNGEFLRKIYYYDYKPVSDYISFPTSISEIEYTKKDSVVSKTNYGNFKVNEYVDPFYLNYQIPEDAKILK